mgnify:FL=1
MYSNLKNVQLLVAMLKAKNIKNIVISPGNSHNAIVRSIEEDRTFKTFNIVDERSAAFFACGLIQQLKEPVAICCTAGTAATNYLTGVTEAFRRNLPLIVITGDKNPYYLAQQEDQMINQIDIFNTIVRSNISLPLIKDAKDEWYCQRILNEALLELNHHGTGPIHINVPIEDGMLAIGKDFTSNELLKISIIERIDRLTEKEKIKSKFEYLKGKKILLIYGQDNDISDEKIKKIEKIFANYNIAIAVDKLSNLHCNGTIELSKLSLSLKVNNKFNEILPDVVLTVAGNVAWDGKFSLKGYSNNFEHWIVNEDGRVQDYYKNLTTIFEFNTNEFLQVMSEYNVDNSNNYYEDLKQRNSEVKIPEFEYSNLYATQKLMNQIPKNSILNLGNSTTIRLAQYFDLDPSIQVYCNRGVNGIDGCMSTYIGQTAVTNKLSFLIIGDLTFFYDMNALWNRYVGKNVRIMLINNSGAALFHFNQGLKNFPTLNENVAAEHNAIAKGWVESLNIKYLSSKNKEEFDNNLEIFLDEKIDKPIIFEVFTKKEEDARLQHEFYDSYLDEAEKIKKNVKNIIKKAIGR